VEAGFKAARALFNPPVDKIVEKHPKPARNNAPGAARHLRSFTSGSI
jgi:hypothetical protein